jgi:hypothetical protein
VMWVVLIVEWRKIPLRTRLQSIISQPFARMTYTEAIELLEKSGVKFEIPVRTPHFVETFLIHFLWTYELIHCHIWMCCTVSEVGRWFELRTWTLHCWSCLQEARSSLFHTHSTQTHTHYLFLCFVVYDTRALKWNVNTN